MNGTMEMGSSQDVVTHGAAQAFHCLYASLASHLVRSGRSLTSAQVCVMSSNLAFGFGLRPHLSYGLPSVKLLGAVTSPVKMRQFLKIDCRWRREPDPEAAWQTTCRMLAEGKVQIVATDIFHLFYLPEHFGRHHFPHIMSLTGIDGSRVQTSDPGSPGWIDREILQQARYGGPLQLEHDWWDIRSLQETSSHSPAIEEAVRQGLSSLLFDQPADSVPHPAGMPPDFRWGVKGAEAFADAIRLFANLLANDDLVMMGQRLYYLIVRETVFPRRAFAGTLREGGFNEAANLIERVADGWAVVAALLLKAFLYVRPADLLVERIKDRVLRTVHDEQTAFQKSLALI